MNQFFIYGVTLNVDQVTFNDSHPIFSVQFDKEDNNLIVDKITNINYKYLVLDITEFSSGQFSTLNILLFDIQQNNYLLYGQRLNLIVLDKCSDQQNRSVDTLWSNIGILGVRLGFHVCASQKLDVTNLYEDAYHIYFINQRTEYSVNNLRVLIKSVQQDFQYCILLQIAALYCQDRNPHSLPFSYAITALNIYHQCQDHRQLDKNISDSHRVFKGELSQLQQNILQLPLHLLDHASFQQFQLLCNVSFLFKPECLALMSIETKYQNAVISQSSRSGKSVTLFTIWFFHLMISQYTPIMINCQSNISISTQPLYQIRDIQLENTFYKDLFSIKDITLEKVKQSLHSNKKQYDRLITDCSLQLSTYYTQNCNYFKFSQSSMNNIQQYVQYLFKELKYVDKDDKSQSDEQEKQTIQQEANTFADLIVLVSNLKFTNIIEKRKQEIQNQQKGDDTIIQKTPILLFDEILSAQKVVYFTNLKFLQDLTNHYYLLLLDLSTNFFSLLNFPIAENLQIKNLNNSLYTEIQEIDLSKQPVDFSYDEASKIILFLYQNYNFLQQKSSEQVNEKIRLVYEKLNLTENIIYTIYKNSISFNSSKNEELTNQINLGILQHFDLILQDIFKQKYKSKNTILYHLFKIVSEFNNVRALESTFIREIQFISGIIQNYEQYKNEQDLTEAQKFVSSYINPCSFLSGTDLTVFNYIQFNELFYQTTGSRLSIPFQHSQLIGGCQFHPSLLSQDYFYQKNITQLNKNSMVSHIQINIQDLPINNVLLFLLTLISQQYSYFQLICPLITPQILYKILSKQESIQYILYNGVQHLWIKINGQKKKQFLFTSLLQNFNKVSISRNSSQKLTIQAQQYQDVNIPSQVRSLQVFSGVKQDFKQKLIFNINQSSNMNKQASSWLQYELFQSILQLNDYSNVDIELLKLILTGLQIHEIFVLLNYIAVLIENENLRNYTISVFQSYDLSSVNLYYFPMCLEENIYITNRKDIIEYFSNHHSLLINFCSTYINNRVLFKQLQFDEIIREINKLQNTIENTAKQGQTIVDLLYKHSVIQAQECAIFDKSPYMVITVFDKRTFFSQLQLNLTATPDYIVSFHNIQDHQNNEVLAPFFETIYENSYIRYFPLEIGNHTFAKSVSKVAHVTMSEKSISLQTYKFGIELSTVRFPQQVQTMYINEQTLQCNQIEDENVVKEEEKDKKVGKEEKDNKKTNQNKNSKNDLIEYIKTFDYIKYFDSKSDNFIPNNDYDYVHNIQVIKTNLALFKNKNTYIYEKNIFFINLFNSQKYSYEFYIKIVTKYQYDTKLQNYFIQQNDIKNKTNFSDSLAELAFAQNFNKNSENALYYIRNDLLIVYFTYQVDTFNFCILCQKNNIHIKNIIGSYVFISKQYEYIVQAQNYINIRSIDTLFDSYQPVLDINNSSILVKIYEGQPSLTKDLVVFQNDGTKEIYYIVIPECFEAFEQFKALNTENITEARIISANKFKNQTDYVQKIQFGAIKYLEMYYYFLKLYQLISWANQQVDYKTYLHSYQLIELNNEKNKLVLIDMSIDLFIQCGNIESLIECINKSHNLEYLYILLTNDILVLQFKNNLSIDQLAQMQIVIIGIKDSVLYAVQIYEANIISIDKWMKQNSDNPSILNYINKFQKVDLQQQIIKDSIIQLYLNYENVQTQLSSIINRVQLGSIMTLFDLNDIFIEQIVIKNGLTIKSILNLFKNYVILKQYFAQDSKNIKLTVQHVDYDINIQLQQCINQNEIQQNNSVVEVEPVQKNTKAVNLSQLQTINQWFSSYPPHRSPEVENYLKLFANLTEENVKNANLELFAKGKTVEEQIRYMIDKSKKFVKDQADDFGAVFDENEFQKVDIIIREIGLKDNIKSFTINVPTIYIIQQLEGFVVIDFEYNATFKKLIFKCIIK